MLLLELVAHAVPAVGVRHTAGKGEAVALVGRHDPLTFLSLINIYFMYIYCIDIKCNVLHM